MQTRHTVFLGNPHYGSVHPQAARAFWALPSAGKLGIIHAENCVSLLAHNFNAMWCAALNARAGDQNVTHFALLHSDVIPCPYWLDVLHEEMEKHNADVVSGVVVIKDHFGLTSTGIANPDDEWSPLFRFTVHETAKLPETFTAADAGWAGYPLLVNTGCILVDIRKPWVEQCFFTIRDKIEKNAEGKWIPRVIPEDWGFSKMAHDAGAKVMATTKCNITHVGVQAFPTRAHPSYIWQTDEANKTKKALAIKQQEARKRFSDAYATRADWYGLGDVAEDTGVAVS